jgi:hypothetical protein
VPPPSLSCFSVTTVGAVPTPIGVGVGVVRGRRRDAVVLPHAGEPAQFVVLFGGGDVVGVGGLDRQSPGGVVGGGGGLAERVGDGLGGVGPVGKRVRGRGRRVFAGGGVVAAVAVVAAGDLAVGVVGVGRGGLVVERAAGVGRRLLDDRGLGVGGRGLRPGVGGAGGLRPRRRQRRVVVERPGVGHDVRAGDTGRCRQAVDSRGRRGAGGPAVGAAARHPVNRGLGRQHDVRAGVGDVAGGGAGLLGRAAQLGQVAQAVGVLRQAELGIPGRRRVVGRVGGGVAPRRGGGVVDGLGVPLLGDPGCVGGQRRQPGPGP